MRRLVPAVLAAGVAPSQHEPAGPPRCASSGSRVQHTEQPRRIRTASHRASLCQASSLNDVQSWPATLAEVRPSRGCRQFGRKPQLTSMGYLRPPGCGIPLRAEYVALSALSLARSSVASSRVGMGRLVPAVVAARVVPLQHAAV
ncbi:uncharacterized protein LOC144102744 [Amblyomma americanum]